jgi:hypothetical protein
MFNFYNDVLVHQSELEWRHPSWFSAAHVDTTLFWLTETPPVFHGHIYIAGLDHLQRSILMKYIMLLSP